MIILPDRNLSRGKVLMPVPLREWMPPSRAQQKTFCGDEDRTRFRLRAKTHDGRMVWQGWFEDRDDADAFLFALVSGSLIYERELWRMPAPEWHPGISPDLVYEFVTQTILTTTGSNQTYTSPLDWNNSSNQIECLGGGSSGGAIGSSGHGTGGGGGAYSAITNFTFATPGTTTATYRVGSGASGRTAISSQRNAGNSGSASWFNNTVDPGNGSDNTKCSAAAGSPGAAGSGAQNGAEGGADTASWGTTKYSGGRGGNLTGASGNGSSGGGGAAGPAGAGGNGGDSSSTSSVSTAGGSANNGTTAGGSNGGGAGNAGTEFSGSHGCGSGSGGNHATGGSTASAAGNYGGGGGAASGINSTSTSGAGRQGLIIIEYTPPSSFLSLNNMPMMGM